MNNENVNVSDPVTETAQADSNVSPPPAKPEGLTFSQLMAMMKKGRMSRRAGSRTPADMRKAKSRVKRRMERASQRANRGR